MRKIVLNETGKYKKTGGYVWKRTCRIVSLCVGLLAGLLLTQPIFAAEHTTQKIRVILVDANYGDGIDGAQFTLAEQVNDSYENMAEKTAIKVSDSGYDFGELSVGAYRLTEDQAPAGYIISTIPIEFQVTAEGVSITNDANAAITLAEDGTYEIAVSNAAFFVKLPSTGGIGTLPYTLGGILLIVTAFVCGFVLRSKREL